MAAVGEIIQDFGELTTSQLHYVVRCINTANTPDPYREPTEVAYYLKLASAFMAIVKGRTTVGPLIVDCANGVGAPKIQALNSLVCSELQCTFVNTNIRGQGVLNFKVSFFHKFLTHVV